MLCIPVQVSYKSVINTIALFVVIGRTGLLLSIPVEDFLMSMKGF